VQSWKEENRTVEKFTTNRPRGGQQLAANTRGKTAKPARKLDHPKKNVKRKDCNSGRERGGEDSQIFNGEGEERGPATKKRKKQRGSGENPPRGAFSFTGPPRENRKRKKTPATEGKWTLRANQVLARTLVGRRQGRPKKSPPQSRKNREKSRVLKVSHWEEGEEQARAEGRKVTFEIPSEGSTSK